MFCGLVSVVFLLAACAASDSGESRLQYPPTDQVTSIFQIHQVPASCRVFAHLFATMPANMTTKDFAARISEEAKAQGADMMLIGQSRQSTTESSLNFTYYGPDREYPITEWPGWSFGLKEWGKQGSWTGIGYDEWLKSDVHYDYPLVTEVAFLRCR